MNMNGTTWIKRLFVVSPYLKILLIYIMFALRSSAVIFFFMLFAWLFVDYILCSIGSLLSTMLFLLSICRFSFGLMYLLLLSSLFRSCCLSLSLCLESNTEANNRRRKVRRRQNLFYWFHCLYSAQSFALL